MENGRERGETFYAYEGEPERREPRGERAERRESRFQKAKKKVPPEGGFYPFCFRPPSFWVWDLGRWIIPADLF